MFSASYICILLATFKEYLKFIQCKFNSIQFSVLWVLFSWINCISVTRFWISFRIGELFEIYTISDTRFEIYSWEICLLITRNPCYPVQIFSLKASCREKWDLRPLANFQWHETGFYSGRTSMANIEFIQLHGKYRLNSFFCHVIFALDRWSDMHRICTALGFCNKKAYLLGKYPV